MMRPALIACTVAALLLAVAGPADARRKHSDSADKAETSTKADKDKKDAKKDESGSKPVQVGTYGDWGAYLAKGKNKTCYALAKPKERKPDVKHEDAYVFIADRPAEKVHNEVSIILGFPVKDGAPATAKVGSANFDLVAKGGNAWIKNQADEAKFVDALKKTGKLVVKAPAAKGPATTDTYSLGGIKQALERVDKDCK